MSRFAAVVYGVVCYLVFFGTFLYAIGFVAGIGVPKHIDSGTTGDFATALLIDVLLLSAFAVQHSVMARPAFKRWWTRFVPKAVERSTYVLASSLTLIALFALWRPLPPVLWNVEADAARIALYAIAALGWLMVLVNTFAISHTDLFGLGQVWRHLHRRAPAHQPFVLRAGYRIVRHPMMLGFLIAFWSTPTMSLGHLLFAVMTTGYILVSVKFLEERDLVAEFGDAYRDYQRRVPMMLPLPGRTASRTTGIR